MGWPVRIGSRSAERPFDWDRPATWPEALDGIGAAYVSYFPDVAVPGTAEVIRSFTDAALASGVRRLVLLSGRGEAEAQACEQVVQASGAAWTVIRSSWFNQNFSEGHFLEPILDGRLALPAGPVGEPFVDADDIADVAVAALTDDRHLGQLYELTGPRLWTFAEAIAEIARVTGRDLQLRRNQQRRLRGVARRRGRADRVRHVDHLSLHGGARRTQFVSAGRRAAGAQSSCARLQ